MGFPHSLLFVCVYVFVQGLLALIVLTHANKSTHDTKTSDDLDPALRTSEGLAAFLLSSSQDGCSFNRSRNVGKSSSWGRDLLVFWREEEDEGEGGKGARAEQPQPGLCTKQGEEARQK